jgi:hypothetical protein
MTAGDIVVVHPGAVRRRLTMRYVTVADSGLIMAVLSTGCLQRMFL